MKRLGRPTAFTLIELVAVFAISGALVGIAAFGFRSQVNHAHDQAARHALKELGRQALSTLALRAPNTESGGFRGDATDLTHPAGRADAQQRVNGEAAAFAIGGESNSTTQVSVVVADVTDQVAQVYGDLIGLAVKSKSGNCVYGVTRAGGEVSTWVGRPPQAGHGCSATGALNREENGNTPVTDADKDGLPENAEEGQHHTDPTNPDTDGDGLPDGSEVEDTGTDPTNPDTDNGGVDDGTEVGQGTDPAVSPGAPTPTPEPTPEPPTPTSVPSTPPPTQAPSTPTPTTAPASPRPTTPSPVPTTPAPAPIPDVKASDLINTSPSASSGCLLELKPGKVRVHFSNEVKVYTVHSVQDRVVGTSGNDIIYTGNGKDTINAMGGDDIVCGGNGKDSINGGSGDDILSGGNGADTIAGEAGNDLIYGGNGPDVITGGAGVNNIDGGAGKDTINGSRE